LGEVGGAARERLELQDRGQGVDQGLLLEEPRPPWMSDGGTLRQRAQAGAQIRTPDLPPPSGQWCWRGDIFETVRRGTRIGSRAHKHGSLAPTVRFCRRAGFPRVGLIPGGVGFHSGQSPGVLRLQTQLSATPGFDAPEARVSPRRPRQKRGSAGWGRNAGRATSDVSDGSARRRGKVAPAMRGMRSP
jgi:hypothetical protein